MIKAEGLTMRYGPVTALDNVSHRWILILRLGTTKHVGGKNVVTSVGRASLIDRLVHVADLDTPRACMMLLYAKANENPVLIKSGALSPVRIVERDEEFVPNHKRIFRAGSKLFLAADELAESQADVIRRLKQALLVTRSCCNFVGIEGFGPSPLLP